MALLILLLSFCSGSWAVTLPQRPAVSAVVGSAVNISCRMQVSADPVTEKILYWYMPGSHGYDEWFVFPFVTENIPNKINRNSIRRADPKHDTDMTLTIADVKLRYTGTYICHLSVRINSKKRAVSGSGTYLLVHEPLDTHIKDTGRIICSTEVQEVEGVSLVWEVKGRQYGSFELQKSQASSRISIELQIREIECYGQRNVTATCLLQYKGMTLTKENIEVPCSEPLDTHIKDTGRIICSTEVQEVADVSLVWEVEGRQSGNFTHMLFETSSLINNELQIGDADCQDRSNVTATCLLQYKGITLRKETIEVLCTVFQRKASQPALLYSMQLVSSALILLIVILLFYMRRKSQKDGSVTVYINYEDKRRKRNKTRKDMDM